MIWTPEKVQELKKMWDSGLSTGEIGRILGVSKNAIVGKVHRLALESRPSPIAGTKTGPEKKKAVKKAALKKKTTAKKTVAKATAKTTASKAGKKSPDIKPETATDKEEQKTVVKGLGVALTDLTPTSCRWPEGDPKDPDFSFCGREVVPGKIYCAEHCAVAYSTLLKNK